MSINLLTKTCFRAMGGAIALAAIAVAATPSAASAADAGSACGFSGGIRHVVYIQFDNTHLLRDNPKVPSDLTQMPHLLNFIKNNGTLFNNDHTILISHTAGGILSSLTGLYPDRHGQIVSNSNVRISSTGTFSFPSSFGYWTDPVAATGTPTVPLMVGPDGKTVPAPWVAFTRAGCNVGGVATANAVLENTGTGATGDITKVFGSGSPEFIEAQSSNAAAFGTAARALAQTDFVGFAIHCAQAASMCASGHDDLLPEEPGGYTGFKGLFGAKAINPLVAGGPVLNDLLGQPIADPFGQPGFPGFDGMSAAVTLAYVAAMQESGVPVTFAYISDAHDFHGVSGNQHVAFGPGDPGYVQQLRDYDAAFDAFFKRLAADGLNKDNTLFVFTVDEGDHFAGVQKTNCNGVSVPCVYGPNEVGEINANIDTLITHQFPTLASSFLGAPAPNTFTVHGDSAPTFYLAKKGAGPLSQTDPITRNFERTIAGLTAVNPYTTQTDILMERMADQTGMKAMHMFTTGDPNRNPTFVFFANPDYFITDFPASTCETCINPLFAWNHGDIQQEIGQTWLGMVGPGVMHKAASDVWTDHVDVRPTMLALLGLNDSYLHDGRVVVEALFPSAVPPTLRTHAGVLKNLGEVYKQINAPFGNFSLTAAAASTTALVSGSDSDDSTYVSMESQMQALIAERDVLALRMKTMLDGALNGHAINVAQANQMIAQGKDLLNRTKALLP
ncbi:MAG TPA: hypothetical protein VK479_07795 [Micropepsaceae bacterium]|nr:hypothetical protein [Micropepsaceae bacterium]